MIDDQYPEILRHLHDRIADATGDTAAAFELSEYIRATWGGRNHYFAKGRPRKPPEDVAPNQVRLFPAPPAVQETETEPLPGLHEKTVAVFSFSGRVADPDAAADLVIEMIKKDLVGNTYIPNGRNFDLAKRNAYIYHHFSRAKLPELCKKYDLTEQRVYQILNAEYKRRQRTLPF